jgi:hypothetical protein
MSGWQTTAEMVMTGINVIITAALLIIALDILAFYALAL